MNLQNKQNFNLNLPSGRRYTNVQSKQRQWKPSIKVGYEEPPRIDISIKDVKIRKQSVCNPAQEPKPCRKRMIETARSNFTLKNSQYSEAKDRKPVKGSTIQVYSKYFKSNLFSKQITPQSFTTRAERKQLPKYRGNNFKQIMQYGNAGQYRSQTITQKCNHASVKTRSISYADLHEYDFRKRPSRF